jgi:hypothetical protein
MTAPKLQPRGRRRMLTICRLLLASHTPSDSDTATTGNRHGFMGILSLGGSNEAGTISGAPHAESDGGAPARPRGCLRGGARSDNRVCAIHARAPAPSWLTTAASSHCMGSTATERKHGRRKTASTGSETSSPKTSHKRAFSAGATTRTPMPLTE